NLNISFQFVVLAPPQQRSFDELPHNLGEEKRRHDRGAISHEWRHAEIRQRLVEREVDQIEKIRTVGDVFEYAIAQYLRWEAPVPDRVVEDQKQAQSLEGIAHSLPKNRI